MGHSIGFYTVAKRKEIMQEALEHANCNVDRKENPSGSYHGNMTIHDDIIMDSFGAAEAKINELDKGWYDDHAVRFRDCASVKPTAAMLKLKDRIKRNDAAAVEYAKKNLVENRKSKFISCQECESKIAVSYLHGSNNCPVCRYDMRSETVKTRLAKFKEDSKLLNKQYKDLEKKLAAKAPIKWLVKVEVHC